MYLLYASKEVLILRINFVTCHLSLSAIGKITSYGNLAMILLAYVCGSGRKEIHFLFDTYHPMALETEIERKLRGADDRAFLITGSEQAPR